MTRQFSLDALGSIHRREAVREWQRVRDSPRDDPEAMRSRLLERSLTAFDMFVLYDDVGDIDEVSNWLDKPGSGLLTTITYRSLPFLMAMPRGLLLPKQAGIS